MAKGKTIILLCYFFLFKSEFLVTATKLDNYVSNKENEMKMLPSDPTNVLIGFYIKDLFDISSVSMDYKINYYYYMEWSDPRLGFNDSILPDGHTLLELDFQETRNIFLPDVSVKNAKFVPQTVNQRFEVNSTGYVQYVREISSTIRCQMYLEEYPLDIQRCPMLMESFTYGINQIQLTWLTTHLAGHNMPVVLSKAVELDSWNLMEVLTGNCSDPDPDPRSCLQIEFVLKRKSSFFIFHMYLPEILLVSASWICFWVKMDPGDKVSLLLTDILSIIVIGHELNGDLPPVSYIKAIDLWNFVCLTFIVLGLIEVSIVGYISTYGASDGTSWFPCKTWSKSRTNAAEKTARRNKTSFETQTASEKEDNGTNNEEHMETTTEIEQDVSKTESKQKKPHVLDLVSRVAFPIAFILFNAYYWSYFLR